MQGELPIEANQDDQQEQWEAQTAPHAMDEQNL
jgi:hypothetical protein